MNNKIVYSTAVSATFWVIWTLLLLILMLFLFFTLASLSHPVVIWNIAVSATIIGILVWLGRLYNRREKEGSELLLFSVSALVLVPMIAFIGCSMMPMRIAG